jgi:branched-chain amino acid transport system substrate-binding protein
MKRLALASFGLLCLAATALTPAARADEVTVASAGPLSGPQAVFGVSWQNGMKLYFDEVNKAGGAAGHTFKLVQLDDKADPREGTLVAQKACENDKVLALLGHLNSGVTLATMPIYSDCGMPMLEFGSNPRITQQGFKNVFQVVANDFSQGKLPAQYIHDTLHLGTAAIVNDKQAFGQGVSEIFAKSFAEAGGKVLSTSFVNPTDVDFTALITQLKAQKPDVIYLGAVMPQLSLFAKQMHEQGLTAKLFVPDGGYTDDFITQAGTDAAEGAFVTFQAPPYDSSPELTAFAKNYKAAFNEEAGPYSSYGYIMAQIVVDAVKSKPATRPGLMDAFRTLDLKTMLGPVSFLPTGEIKTAPLFLYRVQKGKFVLVGHS